MPNCSLSHLADRVLLQALRAIVVRERAITVELLTHLAEVEARGLHLAAGHPSLHHYCVHELHMSEGSAFKRIGAARAGRQHPELLEAVADGRLHLSAVVMLASHLTEANAAQLIRAAMHRTKSELQHLIAGLAPRQDVKTRITPLQVPAQESQGIQLSPGTVGIAGNSANRVEDEAPSTHTPHAHPMTEPVAPQMASPLPKAEPRAVLAPLAPERYELRCTLSREAHDLLRQAQSLLGHSVANGDVPQVLERALRALVTQLEKKRTAPSDRPRAGREVPKGRHIPVVLRRDVWRRDSGQCTFVSEQGRRCDARTRLELDHVRPFAKGGETSLANLRLRCRAHNQHAADQEFGRAFMERKRGRARSGSGHPPSETSVDGKRANRVH